MKYDETLSSLFAKNETHVMEEGDLYKNPALARTLEIIANDPTGTREFYHGQIAKDLIADIQLGGWFFFLIACFPESLGLVMALVGV